MSLLNVDDDQRWVPTHVQVTVLRGRGLRAKGKHGTSDVYTIIQVGKEKFSTCVVEKTTAPEWKEECSFELLPGVLEAEGRSAYPSGSGDLVLTVMHRALIGLDVFLGQAIIPLDKVFQERICMRNEWYKLNSKSGKKEKERGEVQVTVKFTRNNLTASMYDLSMKDKPRSTFGRLKDRMKGKKHNDSESASAVVPSSVGALSHQRARLPSDGGGEEDYEDDEGGEGRRSKMRNFFLRGKLRKSSDTRSNTSLGSESSESSSRGGSLSPTAGISVVVSDLSNSPSESSNLTADNSPEHTTHPSPKLLTHKRALSDEAGQITAPPPPQPHAVASLKAQSGVRSQSSLCINGSHVYAAEPLPHGSTATLGLLQKCSPLSRSLQNLARRTDEPQRSAAGAEGRRWSFDKAGKEEKASALEPESRPVQPAAPAVPTATAAEPAAEGKKQKRNLFSHGWSDSAGKGAEQSHAPPPAEEKHKGWFGSKDSHNKPSPEVSPKVETSSDAVPSLPLTPSPDNPSCARPPASAIGPASPGLARHANPFTPPPVTPTISPSNPFFTRLQCNPFFVELLGDHALKSAPPAPCLSSSPLWPLTVSSSWSDPSPAQDSPGEERGHDVAMARERSHLGVLGTSARGSPNPFVTSPVSENLSEWDESFEAFAASRLGSWKGPPPPARITTALSLQTGTGQILEGMKMQEKSMAVENASPTLLRRPTKIPVLHGRQNHRYDWTQEPGLKKDLFLPPKTDVASPQFVSMCSLIPKSASAGQPIASPYSKDFGETSGRGGARSPAGQEDGPRASATVLHTAEGVGRETDFAGNIPSVCGKEAMPKTASLPEVDSEALKISTYEPDVSLVGTNQSFATIPSHKFSEAHLEGLEGTTTDALKPMYEAAAQQTSTNTKKIVDLPQVTARAPHEDLYETYAHLVDVTNSVLPNTDTASSLSVTIANNTEINNNSTNELATGPSPFVPEVIMNKMNAKKHEGLSSEVLENSLPAGVMDLPIKAGSPSPVSNEGALLECVPDVEAAEILPGESISMALVEVPAGSPVQVDTEDKLVSEEDGPERQRTCAEEALEKEQSHTSTEVQEPISQKLSLVPLADVTSNTTLEESTVTLDAQCNDSDFIALVTHPENANQENCEEEKANLDVKESSSTSAEMNGSTLSDYLEAREPAPPTSPFPDALDFVTAIEDSDLANSWESCDALSAATRIERLPLKSAAGKMAALPEERGFPCCSFLTADSSTAALESVLLERPHSDCDVSQPPPKPPRLFQESVLNEQRVDEYPQLRLGDEAETKHPSGTPKDSPTGLFQTQEVSSGSEPHQTCPSPLPSECSGFSIATEDGWEKTGAKCSNTTYSIPEDELSSGKEILQRGFSATDKFGLDLEENSDQSWLTSKSYFQVKELDTSHFAVWSADEENAIQTDSTHLNKALLMESSAEREAAQVRNVPTQPNTSTGSCSPTQSFITSGIRRNLYEESGGSYLDHLKGAKQQWAESVEPTWQSLPSISGLCSTVSQDLVTDLMPEDLQKPHGEEEKQQTLREVPLDPVLLPQLQPSNPFFGSDIGFLPKGIRAAVNREEELSHPPVSVNPKSSLFLHDCNPQASSTPSLLAETNAQLAFFPSPIPPHLPARPTTGTAQASSSTAPPSKSPPMIDTPFTVLPQETRTAASLPSSQQSSPHAVKPLTTAPPQEEKKSEGRSVLVSGLEKLKSTIHPGRAAQQGEPEADRNKALSEGAAPYYHLSHNELVSLLLQRETELERQGAEFERQGALLEKRETELRKMKAQTRDLEDYIDTLLVRIMEQTPTLLQVRTKLK